MVPVPGRRGLLEESPGNAVSARLLATKSVREAANAIALGESGLISGPVAAAVVTACRRRPGRTARRIGRRPTLPGLDILARSRITAAPASADPAAEVTPDSDLQALSA